MSAEEQEPMKAGEPLTVEVVRQWAGERLEEFLRAGEEQSEEEFINSILEICEDEYTKLVPTPESLEEARPVVRETITKAELDAEKRVLRWYGAMHAGDFYADVQAYKAAIRAPLEAELASLQEGHDMHCEWFEEARNNEQSARDAEDRAEAAEAEVGKWHLAYLDSKAEVARLREATSEMARQLHFMGCGSATGTRFEDCTREPCVSRRALSDASQEGGDEAEGDDNA